MKFLGPLFFVIFVVVSCSSQKNTDWNSIAIEYTANSRGMHQKVMVENQHLWVTQDRGSKPKEIILSPKEWESLKKTYDQLALASIPTLQPPTDKRLYDGAAMANIKIKADGQNYDSKTFDHGFPPKALEKLVNLLVSYTEK